MSHKLFLKHLSFSLGS